MPSVGRFRYLEAASPGSTIGGAHPESTLVLLHAFPLNAGMWESQLSLALHGWRVIAPDLRGFHRGAGDPSASSIDDYAADVIDLLDRLQVKQAVIGGLSMGGYVAFAVLRHAPRYVRALVLADTCPQADTPEAVEGRRRMLELVASRGPSGVADEIVPKLLGPTTRASMPEVVARVRSLVLSNSSEAIASAIRALTTRADSTSLLHTIHCPTLILVGDEDVITPRPLSEEMHRAIAESELVVIPSAGHLSNLEQPDAFNDALARYLTHQV